MASLRAWTTVAAVGRPGSTWAARLPEAAASTTEIIKFRSCGAWSLASGMSLQLRGQPSGGAGWAQGAAQRGHECDGLLLECQEA